MNVKQLSYIHIAFGYQKPGDETPSEVRLDGHHAMLINGLKLATCIPLINILAIGFIACKAKGRLFHYPAGKLVLSRLVISAIAAPILLPIDIIATVAIRLLLKKAVPA